MAFLTDGADNDRTDAMWDGAKHRDFSDIARVMYAFCCELEKECALLSARPEVAPTEVRAALNSIDELRQMILEEQKEGGLPVPMGMFLDAMYRDTGKLADLIRRLSTSSPLGTTK